MPTVHVDIPTMTDETGLMLYLRDASGTLINAGGDELTESPASSGHFTANVAESIAAIYSVRIHDATGVVYVGWIKTGDTLVTDTYPYDNSSNLMGPGADPCTITISIAGVPQDNVAVWISSDVSGATIIAGTLYTDGSGEVTFMLTAGATYYLWAEKSGMNAIQGKLFVAVAD